MKRRSFLGALVAPLVVGVFKPFGSTDNFLKVSPQHFRVNDIIHVPRTGENVLVKAIKPNGLEVVRGIGSHKASGVVEGDVIWNLGSSEPTEGQTWAERGIVEKEELEPLVFVVGGVENG